MCILGNLYDVHDGSCASGFHLHSDGTHRAPQVLIKDGSEILIAQCGKNPRRLTPRECARLMGFDRREGKRVAIPVSDTQAYRQFGNSVVVPVVDAIARELVPRLLHPEKYPIRQPELKLTAS